MTENDRSLIERVRDSDEQAFRVLFERYQPVLFRSMLASLGDGDEAHEVVQETFVRIWKHRRSLRPELPVLGYMFHIARNLVRDAAKRKSVREKYEADVPRPAMSAGDDPEQLVQTRLLEEAVSDIVRERLPDRCREVFLLSRVEGLSNAQIAGELRISRKTVENQITKAMRILRRELLKRLSIGGPTDQTNRID